MNDGLMGFPGPLNLAANPSIGYGQTWKNVTGFKVSGVTYYNTTAKPIFVAAYTNSVGNTVIVVDGVTIHSAAAANQLYPVFFVVPPFSSYSITSTIGFWSELS